MKTSASIAGNASIVWLLALTAGNLWAQARVADVLINDGEVRQPLSNRLPSFNDLVQAKVDDVEGKNKLIVMLESFLTEKREGQVTKFRTEQRTRKVIDNNGQEREQTFTVRIPFTENGQVDVRIPVGKRPSVHDIDNFEFFLCTGRKISNDDVAKHLNSLRPLFLLDRFVGDLPAVPELMQQSLKEDCLIAITSKSVRPAPVTSPMMPLLPAAAAAPAVR